MGPSIDELQRALSRRRAKRVRAAALLRQAAVAAVVREGAGAKGAELLLIRRAENPLDPWSGHMAFPGGHVERGEGAEAAAVRETREEIGLDLEADALLLGRLSPLTTLRRVSPRPMVIHPFVFALGAREPTLLLNHEVSAVVWVPIAFLLDRANRSTLEWRIGGAVPIRVPCYRFHENVLWGLTLRMVDDLLAGLA